jgi:TonB family protein
MLAAEISRGQETPATPPPAAAVPKPKPKPISTVTPVYPAAEEAAGHGGRVVLRFRISDSGAIESVVVEQGTEYPALDAAALEAAKKWRFEAAKDASGKPVASEASYALKFSAEGNGGGVARSCADLNNEVTAFRAASPGAEIGQMKSFAAMTGLFVMSLSSEPVDKRLALVKHLNEVYPKIVERCAKEPAASYSDVFADELLQLKSQNQVN